MKNAIENKKSLIRLLKYALKERSLFFQALATSIINRSVFNIPSIITGLAINIAIKGPNSFLVSWGIAEQTHQLIGLGITLLSLYFFQITLSCYASIAWRKLAQIIQHTIRLEAYHHIQLLDLKYHEQTNAGSLATIINEDTNHIESFVDFGLDQVINIIIDFMSTIVLFLVIKTSLIWLALAPIPVIIIATYTMVIRCTQFQYYTRQHAASISAVVSNGVTNIVSIKSHYAHVHEQMRLAKKSNAYKEAKNKFNRTRFMLAFIMKAVVMTCIALITTIGGIQVLHGTLSVGIYTILISSIKRMLWPSNTIATLTNTYVRTLVSAQQLFFLLDTPINIKGGAGQLTASSPTIEFSHINFAYPKSNTLYRNLNCVIPAGSIVALTGRSGSGKSTLIKLLMRLYEPTSGTISIDGINTKEIAFDHLHGHISFVSQETCLFSGTIYENIIYGKNIDAVNDQDVINAAQNAHAHDFITKLPLGYHTFIGEGGQKLSGGQRQRIALARAFLKNSPILILDEALSANDTETESAIYAHLAKQTAQKTIIIVSHRPAVKDIAHITLVVTDGTIRAL